MIAINLDLAISLSLTLILLLVIGSWLRYTIKEDSSLKETGDLTQCPYCSYVFIDFLKKEIKICPRCESYIENKKAEIVKKSILKNENKATVLITVVMLTLAMTTLAVSILSAIGSQGLLGQNQVDRIKAEQLSKGAFWKYYIQRATTGSDAAVVITETLDGKTYTTTVLSTPIPTVPPNAFPLTSKTVY
jgi:hypothetical protein